MILGQVIRPHQVATFDANREYRGKPEMAIPRHNLREREAVETTKRHLSEMMV